MEYSLDEYRGRYGHSALRHEPWRDVRTNDMVLNGLVFFSVGFQVERSLVSYHDDDPYTPCIISTSIS
jgi:hypothetical protein